MSGWAEICLQSDNSFSVVSMSGWAEICLQSECVSCNRRVHKRQSITELLLKDCERSVFTEWPR